MTPAEISAFASASPVAKASLTQQAASKDLFGDIELQLLVKELSLQAEAAQSGKLAEMEAMLAVQAQTLDTLFNQLAQRAIRNMGEHTMAAEIYMKLALKAQTQARMTVQALAEMKNPRRVSFVQQANIANGPQQVNNGTISRELPTSQDCPE